MPPLSEFKLLIKNDRRKQWKLLKTKHKAALAKAKLNFDLKFGPALDKHTANVGKLAQLAGKRELRDADIQPVFESASAMQKIVTAYQTKVQALPDPARKELLAFLKAIDADRQGWRELVLSLQSETSPAPTDAQRAAAQALVIPLDNIRSMSLTLVTRGQRATEAYRVNQPAPRPGAAVLVSAVVEAARLAGPAAHELATAADTAAGGKNYKFFKERAKAAVPVITRLRKAAANFDKNWDMNSDVMTISINVDAQAVRQNFLQTAEYCDDVLAKVGKLP
jgi:hypothetical protein